MRIEQILENVQPGQTVALPPGSVEIGKPVVLGSRMSGVTFVGDCQNGTVFEGGRRVSNWQEEGKYWVADLPEGHHFLWRNGSPVVNSRYPATGTLHCVKWENNPDYTTQTWEINRLHYALPKEVINEIGEAEIVLYFGWQCCRLRGLRADGEIITMPGDLEMFHSDECDFALENLPLSFLTPGQWHPDSNAGKLYYLPLPGEKIGEGEFFTGGTEKLFVIDGADNVTFENVTFTHTGDNRICNSHQADHRNSAAVELHMAKNCQFRNCTFTALACWGADLLEGAMDNSFIGCSFSNLGSGAVKMSGGKFGCTETDYCCRNKVQDCVIRDGGQRWAGCTALLIRHGADNELLGNDISRFPYSGISCGWVWGYRASISSGNKIIGNLIHDLGHDNILMDMGGIYLLGEQPEGVVAGNHIWNLTAKEACWGIYLDEGSSNIDISGNLVHDCTSEPFHVHFGRHNRVHGNVLIAGPGVACSGITTGTMVKGGGYFLPGDKVFDFSGNLCIANGMPFYLKYIYEMPNIQTMLDTWAGDGNFCWQLDPSCTVHFCDDWHCYNLTYTAISDEEFMRPGRDEHTRFFTGPLPTAEELRDLEVNPELISLYEQYLNMK